MISKELIKEVIQEEPDHIELIRGSKWENNIKQTILLSYNNGEEPIEINIYELAHKCKEWAIKNKYQMYSGITTVASEIRKNYFFCAIKTKVYAYNKEYSNCLPMFLNNFQHIIIADTEPEAIFKACEYILKELK